MNANSAANSLYHVISSLVKWDMAHIMWLLFCRLFARQQCFMCASFAKSYLLRSKCKAVLSHSDSYFI